MPNEDGRLVVYVGEMRGVYDVAGEPTDIPKPEFMLVAGPYGSDACAQTTLCCSPAVKWYWCIGGEGMYGM